MSTNNEALVRRFFEEFCNDRRAEVADELIASDYVSHGPQAPPAEGPDGVRQRVGLYQDSVDRSLSSPVRRFVFEFSERRPPSCRLAC